MTTTDRFHDLDVLLAALCDETVQPEQITRLESLANDADGLLYVVDYLQLDGLLRWENGSGNIEHPPIHSESLPSAGFFSATFHGTIGFSSGWPVAYSIATVITGLWLLSFWLMPVSRPEQVATHSVPPAAQRQIAPEPAPASVGRITGMVDCKWEKEGSGFRVQGSEMKAHVFLGQNLVLASGLMEITYDTGAKVILQGPVTYEVESNGGYLAVGRLTGKLGKEGSGLRSQGSETANQKSPDPRPLPPDPFVIRTPTATVTDLGTEFGVEVTKDEQSRVNVLHGKVVVRLQESATSDKAAPREIELSEGDVAYVEPHGELKCYRGSQAKAVTNVTTFVRTLSSPPSLVAYWPMDEGRGRVAHDRTSDPLNSYLLGGAGWTKGRFGNAVSLPGSGPHVTCITDPKLSLGTGDFTFSLWFKGASADRCGTVHPTPLRYLVNYNELGAPPGPPSLVIMTKSDKLVVHAGSVWETDVFPESGGPTTFNDTDWYHIAVVRQGAMVAAYVNGAREGVGASSVDLQISSLSLATEPGSAKTGLIGAIDDVAIWKQALTPAQIKALADGIATPLNVLLLDPFRPAESGNGRLSPQAVGVPRKESAPRREVTGEHH